MRCPSDQPLQTPTYLSKAALCLQDIFSGRGLAALGHAILGWLVAMPIIIVALSLALKPVFAWAALRWASVLLLLRCVLGQVAESRGCSFTQLVLLANQSRIGVSIGV